MTTYRIGAGSGFAGDRFEPAEILAARGGLDALVFECLAERTIGLAQQRAATAGAAGYDRLFIDRLAGVLPALSPQTLLLTNAGAADPVGLGRAVVELLAQHPGVAQRSVAAIVGDDVTAALPRDARVTGTDLTIADLGDRVVSANAYIGAGAAMAALEDGADIVVTGRMGDAALFAAPVAVHHGWSDDSPEQMAAPTLVGHLLECAGQLTGGYFADGGRKAVPGLATLGFPFADVACDGSAEFGKVAGTGGLLSRATVLEQLLYEIDDPAHYKTPDATLDLGGVRIEEIAPDRVRVSAASAHGRPGQLKVSVGVRDGFLAVGSIAYAGRAARARAELALRIVRERWAAVHGRDADELRLDLQGHNSLRPWYEPDAEPAEVRARMALRTFDPSVARLLQREVEALYTNGPAGGGGVELAVRETVGIVSTFIDRDRVHPRVEMLS
ncbi:acyclic terpene utilization AtuA family protein [Microbacterium sp. NPDC091313]